METLWIELLKRAVLNAWDLGRVSAGVGDKSKQIEKKANEVSLIADIKYIHKLYTLTAVCVLAVEQVFARSGSSISQVWIASSGK